MKRKKKGSSLIAVIFIMAILFTLGTAMLAVTAGDYKMRINENKKIENLYKADSGLDIVYNIILKASEASILASEKATEEESLGTNKSLDELDTIFRNKYLKILGEEAKEKGKNQNDALLARAIIEGKYFEFDDTNNVVVLSKKSFNNANIEILEYTYLNDKIIIKVKSTFEDSVGNTRNTKAIETSYELAIPKYQKNIVNESVNKEINIYPVFDNKIITADGNMSISGDVNNSGEVNIKGNIWVMGNEQLLDNPAYAFDKYNGGISLENVTLNMSGNISTNKTLHLKTASNAQISGNIYALNAYVGKYYDDGRRLIPSINNSLKPKSDSELNLVVNNDLAMNAESSNIQLTNFYGVNDKTSYDAKTPEKAMKSSSIIVNSTDSSLTVTNDAYIMGVANIDATDEEENKYQTGESVAVKGNYLAYNSILPGYEDRVTLKYYSPLQLIDTIDGNNSVKAKAEYFEKYYEINNKELRTGGISLNNVEAIGAYVDIHGNVKTGNFSGNDTLNEKRNDFATNVYSMSNTSGITKSIEELYANGTIEKTVSNQIDFTELDSNEATNETYGKLYINSSKKNVVVIKGNNDNKIYYDTSNINYEVIDGSNDMKSVIITNGDVIITGEVNFTGNIITTGNVEFINGGKKNLVYDSEITRKIIASNYDAVEKAFEKGTSIGQVDNVNIGEITIIQDTTNGYDMKSLLSNGTWKIVK